MSIETERLSLKILQSDKVALRRLSRDEGEPMSVLVRRILRNELRRQGLIKTRSIIKERIHAPSIID